MISTVEMRGIVVIGEGEKDNAPMLFNGEEVGDGTGPECDVAVDPIDGTTLTAKGMNNAVSVLAVAPRGSMYDPSAVFYMEKLVTGPEAADVVDIRLPGRREHPPRRQGQGHRHPRTSPSCMLDRPRHDQLVDEIRATGARIKFITDGDVAGAIMAARPDTGIDLLLGIGGTPGGHHRRLRDEVHRRRDPGPAVAARTTRSGSAPSTPATTSTPTRARAPTTWSPATTASSWPPASPTAS